MFHKGKQREIVITPEGFTHGANDSVMLGAGRNTFQSDVGGVRVNIKKGARKRTPIRRPTAFSWRCAKGAGTIFEIANTATRYPFVDLCNFSTSNCGSTGGLAADTGGNLFGTSTGDGRSDSVFELGNIGLERGCKPGNHG